MYQSQISEMIESPPSRGAWIEIDRCQDVGSVAQCRPPRGGRGLKYQMKKWHDGVTPSPPSRGAWIEIWHSQLSTASTSRVAPLAGGVD